MAKSKSLHGIKMAEDYLKSFEGFWTEFEKLPEGFRFLLLNNMANYTNQQCSVQRALCQQEIWRSKSAIVQTDSWVVSPKKLDFVMLNAPDPVDISLVSSD